LKNCFAECFNLALGKEAFAECFFYTRQRNFFAKCFLFDTRQSLLGFTECFLFGTRQNLLCRVPEKKTLGKASGTRKKQLPVVKMQSA
jgi:hypothetical protein